MPQSLIKTREWYVTSSEQPRGFIAPHALSELWFHTGTACNLACPFCLEGSRPGDTRLSAVRLSDVEPFVEEALSLNVERFAFTGGEPMVIKDFVQILALASEHRPCLVLSNGTDALHQRFHQIEPLRAARHPVQFRISLDHPDAERHDAGRGTGRFAQALEGIRQLAQAGFDVSVARQMSPEEDTSRVESEYAQIFRYHGIAEDTKLVAFPDFLTPNSRAEVPEITEDCMTRYQTETSRRSFMCAYTKMVVKQAGRMRVYACTLVDDDPHYDLGSSLTESLDHRILLKHHRCYSCFAYGSSCSG